MPDGYRWEHNTSRRHIYLSPTGEIVGTLYERLSDRVWEARIVGMNGAVLSVGEYAYLADARLAVEYHRDLHEQAAAQQQADGVKE